MDWTRRRLAVGGLLVVLVMAAMAAVLTGGASAATTRYVTSVVFTGTSAAPTITVNGVGFGSTAPTSYPANVTSCGTYTDNGRWYGANGLWFFDDAHLWQAGKGTGTSGNCIGIKLVSWASTKVVFNFGNAYGSFDHWTADATDNYVLDLKGFLWGGVVSYS